MLKENAVRGQAISPVLVDTRERSHISYDETKKVKSNPNIELAIIHQARL